MTKEHPLDLVIQRNHDKIEDEESHRAYLQTQEREEQSAKDHLGFLGDR